MERTIDARAVVGPEAMEQAAIAACFAKNSCTWSSGRPPFVAAFGRVPRLGMNLLSDQHGLVAGRTREQAQREADYMRAEAQQHLSAMSVDSNLRRALLREVYLQPTSRTTSWFHCSILAMDCEIWQEERWIQTGSCFVPRP